MPSLKSFLAAFSWPANAFTVWRHRWLIAIVVLVTAGSAALLGVLRPRAYLGDALVQVEPQQVPDRLVAAPVAGDWQDRLAALSQQILTSASLLPVMNQFRLFPGERRRRPMEEVLGLIRQHTEIRMERAWTRERPGAFHVSFEYGDPVVAAAVANHLASALIRRNVLDRQSSASGTSDFLESQLRQSLGELEAQDARLTGYRLAHVGEIPGQEGALVAALNRLQLQWQSVQEGIARAERTHRITADALYTAQLAPVPAAVSPDTSTERLRQQLNTVRSRYGDRHPEVVVLQAEAAVTRALETAPAEVDNARLRQRVETLASELRANAREQARLTKLADELLSQMAAYQTRLERLPLQEVQWNRLNSDHEIARQKYVLLLEKRSAAQLSAELERRQKDETFRLLEPASAPVTPKGLGWGAFLWLGSLSGLLAGVAAAFVYDLSRGVVQGAWELPAGIALLGRVPALGAPASGRILVRREFRTAPGLSMVAGLFRPPL